MTMEDRPGTDCERMESIQATPFSRSCSSGTVMSCSISSADRPSASVWTSTTVGVNSGRESTSAWRSCQTPKARITAAAAMTPRRARMLPLTRLRITSRPPVPMWMSNL